MTVYNISQLADVWVRYGGDPRFRAIAAGVATAESGGNQYATSPSSDYGLWQINSIHFGSIGINAVNWSNDDVQAHAAISLSSNGTNWAAWCTCWSNPGPNCGHGYLPYPQNPSPAYGPWQNAQGILGTGRTQITGTGPVSGINAATDAWNQARNLFGVNGRNISADYGAIATAIERMKR